MCAFWITLTIIAGVACMFFGFGAMGMASLMRELDNQGDLKNKNKSPLEVAQELDNETR